jgi:aminoglycoside 3-N-acetyltransferase
MGIVAETFRQLPGAVRSDHPTSSFAARGPLAKAITAPQPLEPGHGLDSPIGRVYEAGGWVLLLGVGHEANTSIHLTENLAGVPYRVRKWTTVLADGEPRRVEYDEIDHCCRNFELVGRWLDEHSLQRHGAVGHADALLAMSADIVGVTVPILQAKPLVFLCLPDAACEDCDQARASLA